MSRSVAVASSLLRRLAAASSLPQVPTRSISAVPAGPLRPFNPARTPRPLPPLSTPSRGFARGRRESVPSEDDDVEEVTDDDDDDVDVPATDLGLDSEADWFDDGESVDELKDESD